MFYDRVWFQPVGSSWSLCSVLFFIRVGRLFDTVLSQLILFFTCRKMADHVHKQPFKNLLFILHVTDGKPVKLTAQRSRPLISPQIFYHKGWCSETTPHTVHLPTQSHSTSKINVPFQALVNAGSTQCVRIPYPCPPPLEPGARHLNGCGAL